MCKAYCQSIKQPAKPAGETGYDTYPIRRTPVSHESLTYRLHLAAMSNMSLHCISRVLPFIRTFELVHVRCTACMTSSAAKPMAVREKHGVDRACWRRAQGPSCTEPRGQLPSCHTGASNNTGLRGPGCLVQSKICVQLWSPQINYQ